MSAGAGVQDDAGGGPARHLPVLVDEVIAALGPREGMVIVDGTFGAGGYTAALLARGASVVAIDRDPDAITAGRAMERASGGRLRLVHGAFSRLDEHAGQQVDGIVLDIGVSSMQVDEAGRGFSFRLDGPLDMRMAREGPTAADVVNRYKTGDLARIFGFYGEERHAGRIARAVERRRAEKPYRRTGELAHTIEQTIGRNPKDKIHPATRVFQALRIYVNDELGELARALIASEAALKPGGRLAVVTFHSLEDRMVKRFLADRSSAPSGSRHLPQVAPEPETFDKPDKVVTPGEAEIARNARARSAKLRAATRTAAPARRADLSMFALPDLPDLSSAA
ncbi:MAG: 16S rRNA (cytosine(1402)-N(4))-methyltransferase RsmH [Rhizobiaceae bacterium]|nr:16S rRNA (cytosine(1402)-N(4))-methyltransferase RsmH [Rhizobiaceae bacterium]MCV0406556.1 16S rRNA (cytosine(1402)-N(4))-methyltransferase RsmH [Rhizobiaceae bacterium]